MTVTQQTDLLVRRDRLEDIEFVEAPVHSGGALIEVERFSFGANNVTYAMVGEVAGYWSLFPAPGGMGRIPVWGIGKVVKAAGGLREGERVFGAFPMSTHLAITPRDVSGDRFSDGAAHRQRMAPAYNEYLRIDGDDAFAGPQRDLQLLLRWQFLPAVLMRDSFAKENFFGAKQVVISSGSSKTAISLAHLLAAEDVAAVALTSAKHKSFVERAGQFDRVLAYDELAALPREPALYVDMAGRPDLRAAVHAHLGDALRHSCRVGLTHRDARRDEHLPGPAPVWFNTADVLRKRIAQEGQEAFDRTYAAAWQAFAPVASAWLKVVQVRGRDEVKQAYRAILRGDSPPDNGYIFSLAG